MERKDLTKKSTYWIIVGSDSGGGTQNVAKRIFENLSSHLDIKLIFIRSRTQNQGSDNLKIEYLNRENTLTSIPLLFFKILKEKPKKILCLNIETSLALLLLSKVMNFKIFTRCMNTLSKRITDKSLSIKTRIITKLYLDLIHSFDKVICQCKCMEKDLHSQNEKSKLKTSVIYNPTIEVKKISSNNKSKKFLFIGRLVKQKNVQELINIFSEYIDKYENVQLDIFGTGPDEDLLKNEVKKLNKENCIQFLGYLGFNEISFSDYNAIVLNSKYEGFPNVLIEGLCMGLKIISKDIKCGPSEIIIHKENGWLVSKSNKYDWFAALTWALSSNINPKLPKNLDNAIIINQYQRLFEQE